MNRTVAPLRSGDSSWVARQPAVCGEIRGRVLDGRNGAPLAQAYVTIDSSTRGIATDSLGQFRIIRPSTGLMPRTLVRIRYVGLVEQAFYLPPHLGYVVEATLAAGGLHIDGVSTLRIKTPGFCERAT